MYYGYEDFVIGNTLNIYNRNMTIVDADGATRKFFASKFGIDLKPRIPVDGDEPRVVRALDVPPHNGWGSEEDSLGSCVSLVPKAPKTPFDVHGAKLPNQKLQFEAKMVTNHPDDVDRKFVIQYFVENNTIKVHEPPQRNTGVVGGTFLARKVWTNPDTGKPFAETDLVAGATVRFVFGNNTGYIFKVTDVDLATLK